MLQAREKAREFLECQQAFRLGELLTESSHPKTRRLSQTMETDVAAGVRLLQAVDEDIPAALERIFAQDSFGRLVEALAEAMRAGRRIFFTGCGATGRLSILLEAAWREFWRAAGRRDPQVAQPPVSQASCPRFEGGAPSTQGSPPRAAAPHDVQAARMQELCVSIMAGGDFALIKSVEGFEDFPDFGRHQLAEAGVQRGDVVVAITEGGETPFVIGTAWQGLDAGAQVFFVYNNPTDLLRRHVQRSRAVIEEPRIHKLDLATGPMAVTGSTRMQATTTELLVIGAAIEIALARVGCAVYTFSADEAGHDDTTGVDMPERAPNHAYASVSMAPGSVSMAPELRQHLQEYRRLFERLLGQLSSLQAVVALARVVELEEQVYRRRGLVTYAVDSLMLDVLTDTTERSPTFMVPPFRKEGDRAAPVSWAFVKNPYQPTEQAWRDMLQREPRGLTWGTEVFRQLNAPMPLQANPPQLDNAEIYRFRIGNEPDASRTETAEAMLIIIDGWHPQAQPGGGSSWGPPSPSPAGLTMPPGGETPRVCNGHQPSSSRDASGVHSTPYLSDHSFRKRVALTFGPAAGPLDVDEHIHIACDLPASPLRLWEHLAIKLILNTLSTATMVRMGRVIGNAMVWVSPSNKKLIDRGCRLIVHQTGCTYEHACEVLHEAMDEVAGRAQRGEEVPSPVALAIERLRSGSEEKNL